VEGDHQGEEDLPYLEGDHGEAADGGGRRRKKEGF